MNSYIKVTQKIVLLSSLRIKEYHNVIRQLLTYSLHTIFCVTKIMLTNDILW